MTRFELNYFIQESNRIEGIERMMVQLAAEISATEAFLAKDTITTDDLLALLAVYQPDAKLRDKPGMDVRVGKHKPPPGGPDIVRVLKRILIGVSYKDDSPYWFHHDFETLHPFTDGNGRVGRALWLWQMFHQHGGAPLGFLHTWYYQSLDNGR